MSTPYISQIIMFGGNFTIQGYAKCNGQLLAIAQNQALYSLLGTTYGGDGRTSFGLPDLRSRVPIASGQSPGTSFHPLGNTFGQETVALTVNELPAHSHAAMASADLQPGAADPTNRVVAPGKAGDTPTQQFTAQTPTGQMASAAVGAAGGGQRHDNTMPSLVIAFQIALVGAFPSRN